jgi:hypothetical protein
VDNALGYVLGNVMPCCATCNEIKGTALDVACMHEMAPLLHRWRLEGRITKRRRPGRPVGSGLKSGPRYPCGKLIAGTFPPRSRLY